MQKSSVRNPQVDKQMWVQAWHKNIGQAKGYRTQKNLSESTNHSQEFKVKQAVANQNCWFP